jgi:hypothetical protein
MKFQRDIDPMANMLQKGIALWRPCSFSSWYRTVAITKAEVVDVDYTRSPDRDPPQFIMKLGLTGEHMNQPELRPFAASGIVVFWQGELDVNWTHMFLTGVSKSFKEPTEDGTKGCVFARPAPPACDIGEYEEWRKNMAMEHQVYIKQSWDAKVQLDLAEKHTMPGVKQLHVVRQRVNQKSDIAYAYNVVRG